MLLHLRLKLQLASRPVPAHTSYLMTASCSSLMVASYIYGATKAFDMHTA